MNAQPLLQEDRRPHLELVGAPGPRRARTPEAAELHALPRISTPRRTLTMAGVTSGLQLLLAARRSARFSTLSD